MAQDKESIKSTYPLPIYNYRVTLYVDGEAEVMGFAEVSGLVMEYEPVTYKHGLSFVMGSKIIPGMKKPLQITLKRGVVKGNSYLKDWISNTYSDPFYSSAKRDVVIDLCDETAVPLVRWTVQGALPIKLEAPTFDANSNDVAIESLELIAHGLKINYDP